jgi:hypothetical protein
VSERVFDKQLKKAGFRQIEMFGHQPYGIDDLIPYPLFPEAFLDALRRLLSPAHARNLAAAVVIRACKP